MGIRVMTVIPEMLSTHPSSVANGIDPFEAGYHECQCHLSDATDKQLATG
jgi:hypothetical protein